MKEESIQQQVQTEIDALSQKKRKDMNSGERVRLLQLKLYLKAKQESGYKFYVLYDKIFQPHILEEVLYDKSCRKAACG